MSRTAQGMQPEVDGPVQAGGARSSGGIGGVCRGSN
jgi:hypothetical protein